MPWVTINGNHVLIGEDAAGGGGLKVYHGSPQSFKSFDIKKSGTTTDAGLLGKGVYFSTDPRVGSNQPHQYESTLSLSHPLNINQPDFRTNKNDIVRAALSLPKSASASDVTKHAMAMGYDGVVLDYKQTGYNQKEIAVFDTTAIKATRRLK